ncbi:thiol:disulfide interchange protein [bacterium]|nr:thiol:disulfide interchange protein [bacterium]|tara:strand:- start:41 stop:760 length:720 start_codon:yes stop_codon:yes gene_type:complete
MKSFLALTLIFITNIALADVSLIINKLKPFFPEIKAENITSSQLDGFYEVVLIDPRIDLIYISIDGKYVIQGAVTDLELMKNISTNRINSIKLNILESINDNDKIIFRAKDEQYVINVFTDVDCPYCAKLHANMNQMNNLGITVKYLASPLEQLHPNAQSAMEKIWCAENRELAMHNYKTKRYLPESADCINPVASQLAISKQLGVNGTPSIFFENGTNLPGYLPPKDILNRILQTVAQ